jgi:4-amino-4-deoxy-L-arabinose transferase-like glycosyltransferase
MTHTFWFIRGVQTRSQDHLSGSVINVIEAGDAGTYLLLARNLRFHQIFGVSQTPPITPSYYRAPGYPFFIASLWTGGEYSPPLVMLCFAQSLLGIAITLFTYLIADRSFGRTVAMLAGFGMALAPMSGVWMGEIMSETLYTFLVVLAAWFWTSNRYKLAGLAFGLSWLVRPTTMAFLAFAIVVVFLLPVFRSQRREVLIMTVTAVLVIVPWTIRNAVVFHKYVLVAQGSPKLNLLAGTLDIPYHSDIWQELRAQPSLETGYAWDDPRSEEIYFRRAVERIKGDPLHWLLVRAKQYPRLLIDLGAYLYPASRALTLALKYSFLIGNVAVLGLAAWGFYLGISHPEIILFPIFLLLFHLPLWVEPRYSLPMMPFVILLAALAAEEIRRIYRRRFMRTVALEQR